MSSLYLAGLDSQIGGPRAARAAIVVGGDVLGAIDVGQTQRDLNAMRALTVAQARVLLSTGQRMIEAAIASAGSLPGDGARQNVRWKLRWHSDALSKIADPGAPYASAADLQKWVQQAAIELNATDEGRHYQQASWDAMVSEIGSRAAAVAEAPGRVMDTVASVPTWLWLVGGVIVAALVGGVIVFLRRR